MENQNSNHKKVSDIPICKWQADARAVKFNNHQGQGKDVTTEVQGTHPWTRQMDFRIYEEIWLDFQIAKIQVTALTYLLRWDVEGIGRCTNACLHSFA